MPLWVIHHPADAFESGQKQRISELISDLYSVRFGLPRFYTVVIFQPTDTIFVGGQQSFDFIRIVVSHLARESNRNEVAAEATKTAFNCILRPYIETQGYNWELSYSDSPRLFWQINGMNPPLAGSEGEMLWAKENRAVPYNFLIDKPQASL